MTRSPRDSATTHAPAGPAAPGGRRPPGRRALALAATGIAVAVAGTATGGAIAAATIDRPATRAVARPPAAPARVTNVARGGQIAPLRRVVPPDVLAVAARPVSAAQVGRIRRLKQVQDVIAVDAGAVQLQGRQVNTFAVDPSLFRSWTPPGTAKDEGLWTALAGGRFIVSETAMETMGLRSGFGYSIVGKSVPQVTMGGAGTLGLPGIDMLVNLKTGADLQLVPRLAVLVNAPGADGKRLSAGLKKILGSGGSVLNLHEKKNQVSGGSGRSGSGSYLDLYKRAATTCPGLSWTVLAAIGQIESDHGRNAGPSSAGALGPMQFMPATWKAYGVDGDGDGKADIMNPFDAVPGAAKYLCANGAGGGGRRLYNAIFRYNHADWYVQKVLNLAKAYARAYS
ncbi:lytic transglycosylase domain-containing protein [Actinomadura scrupuli]|uniref:lytic transglycosylase domain-containing protein n=1 Tax=Actinomadura scrupuli TaxID=559629 RepID=UPI003D96BD06